jgi:hypothetical protein
MSTRSSITVKIGEKYHSVYCHFDGHPSHHGDLLLNHYNSQELAEKVVSLGDLSQFMESMDKPEGHSYKTPVRGYSIAYGRDRGESDVDTKILNDISEVNEQDYNYLWDGDKWLVDGKVLTPEMCVE